MIHGQIQNCTQLGTLFILELGFRLPISQIWILHTYWYTIGYWKEVGEVPAEIIDLSAKNTMQNPYEELVDGFAASCLHASFCSLEEINTKVPLFFARDRHATMGNRGQQEDSQLLASNTVWLIRDGKGNTLETDCLAPSRTLRK